MRSGIAQIQVNSIIVPTIIGWYDYERYDVQDVVVNALVELYDNNWMAKDKLDMTVDYDQLVDCIVTTTSKTQYKLLESLAQHLANTVLEQFYLIKNVRIELIKPAINGIKAREIKVSYTVNRQFKVALALGSNSENLPMQQLITAIEILGEYISDVKIGGFYSTKPVGYTEQADFYNTAIIGYTSLRPEELLGKLKSIEKLMGKKEMIINGPRVIDIDLILFADLIYTHNFLNVPHKYAHLRDFVLQPLVDIEPEWVHPKLNKTLSKLLAEIPLSEHSIIKQSTQDKHKS